jgi:hypothetical protein
LAKVARHLAENISKRLITGIASSGQAAQHRRFVTIELAVALYGTKFLAYFCADKIQTAFIAAEKRSRFGFGNTLDFSIF